MHDEEKEIAQAINPKGRVRQALLLARSSTIHENQGILEAVFLLYVKV